MAIYGLPKKERLKSRKAIESIFKNGRKFAAFPVLVWYQLSEAEKTSIEIGVTCSSRHFKRAVDRNRIKRLLREAYRLQKQKINESLAGKPLKLQVFFVYTDKLMPDYQTIYAAMGAALEKLGKRMGEGSSKKEVGSRE